MTVMMVKNCSSFVSYYWYCYRYCCYFGRHCSKIGKCKLSAIDLHFVVAIAIVTAIVVDYCCYHCCCCYSLLVTSLVYGEKIDGWLWCWMIVAAVAVVVVLVGRPCMMMRMVHIVVAVTVAVVVD